MEDNKKIWEQYQKDMWTSSWETGFTTIPTKIEFMKSSQILHYVLKTTSKKDEILEAGCGLGHWVLCLHDMGYDITGLDFSEETIERLREHYSEYKWTIGDITDFEYPDESFDTMLSWGVVEHFEEGPLRALEEAFRVLKKGGKLHITVPCRSHLFMLFLPLLYIKDKLRKNKYIRKIRGKKTQIKFYQYEFRPNFFLQYLRKAGFKIKFFKPISHENGFAGLVNRLLRISNEESTVFYKRIYGNYEKVELTQWGQSVCNRLNNFSPWFTPEFMYAIAEKP